MSAVFCPGSLTSKRTLKCWRVSRERDMELVKSLENMSHEKQLRELGLLWRK